MLLFIMPDAKILDEVHHVARKRGDLLKAGTESGFFRRGKELARLADKGAALPKGACPLKREVSSMVMLLQAQPDPTCPIPPEDADSHQP